MRKLQMIRLISGLVIATCALLPSLARVPTSSLAQDQAGSVQSPFDEIRRAHEQIEKQHRHRGAGPSGVQGQAQTVQLAELISQPFDVKHYRLQIQLVPEPSPSISGTVSIEAEAISIAGSISIDAQSNLTIDAVRVDGTPRSFQRRRSQVTLDLSPPLPAGSRITVALDYHGIPVRTGALGGGMLVADHGTDRTIVIANLSEPYAAPSWWPCIDNPADKATAEVEITVPGNFQAASNGLLSKIETHPDGTSTSFWREDYPISTYLVCVAATNYERFEDTYTAMDGVTRMPLVYYVYPEHLLSAQQKFAVTRRAIEIFAGLYGEYPFINEKYGMVEFPWGGAMEHQTMTSMGQNIISSQTGTGQSVIVHELAHHWWGDLVTMRTWNDIWLNEGFATYSEVLFFERFSNLDPGELMSRSYDDGKVMGRMGGTVTAEDLDNPFDDTGAIYTKGGWVLHMLRHLLGDQGFFDALKDYRQQFAFGNASTADFQRVCEQHYGSSLDWFFAQWIYATGRPFYKIASEIGARDSAGNYTVMLTIKQKQEQQIPGRSDGVYTMPLDVTIHYVDGTSEKRVIRNETRVERYTFVVSKQPARIVVDENHWVLKKLKGS
jgi:aminopeptidase N